MARPRKLSGDELRLWKKIAASTKPYHKDLAVEAEPMAASEPARPAAKAVKPRTIVTKAIPQTKPLLAEASGHKKVRRGKLEIDARIDLHGMKQVEAQAELLAFVIRHRREGARCLLVVTGKGRPIDPGEDYITPQPGVIRRRLPEWLNAPGLRPHVSGFASAHAKHGGTGAYYVLLKRREDEV